MHEGHENKEKDHQLKKFSIVKKILLDSTLGNVWQTVWRICIMMLGLSVIFNDVYFFLWISNFNIYLLPADICQVCTGNLTHCRQTLQLINCI